MMETQLLKFHRTEKNSIIAILGHLETEPKHLHDLSNSKILERCFSEGPEMMVHQKPKALTLTINALHNQYLHFNLFGKNGKNVLLCDTLYLPVPLKNEVVIERQERCEFFLFVFVFSVSLFAFVCVFFYILNFVSFRKLFNLFCCFFYFTFEGETLQK